MNTARLRERFVSLFGAEPRLFRAPGRVNLIGEHTDYLGGRCLPMAVDRSVVVAAAPRADRSIVLVSTAFCEERRFAIDAIEGPAGGWDDLLRGVADGLRRAHLPLVGVSAMLSSDIPIGGGLSSSAAAAVGFGYGLLAVAGASLSPLDLARAAQQAEHEFLGTRCGLLDQIATIFGRAGHCLHVDCATLAVEPIPLDKARVRFLVVDTKTKHDLAGSAYNRRRAEAESGHVRRVAHVASENERVLDAVAALRSGRFDAFGALLFASHRSLHDDYDVSCPELDCVVDACAGIEGVFGAKMTGGGFGGCVVVAVSPGTEAEVQAKIERAFRDRFGRHPDVFAVRACDGVEELQRPGGLPGDTVGKTG